MEIRLERLKDPVGNLKKKDQHQRYSPDMHLIGLVEIAVKSMDQ
jgi:hypothetical protein